MITRFALSALAALTLSAGIASAAEEAHLTDYAFSFEGPFGSYDTMQLQRGLQVYTEVCSACHGMQYVAYRSLSAETGPAIPEDQVRAYAAQYEVLDPELEDYRPALPTDHFPHSALENAPDLSLMAKARAGFHGPYGLGISQFFRGIGGPEYITNLLVSYTGEYKEEAGAVLYENHVFPGGWIAMNPPLVDDQVEYADGSPTDALSLAKDVSAYLMWAAEPKLVERKQAGFTGVLMLTLLSVLLYLTNKRIWAPVKRRAKAMRGE